MLSKLVVWGADRHETVGRLRRALGEYHVAGIKTTVPFFRWLLDQPEFTAGRFHTTYLDDVLRERNGKPFVEAPLELEEVAAIAAVIDAVLSPASSSGTAGRAQPWKAQARIESLRE
jgi:acetyl/propionyl-CoA carboxylase alpha subunit